MDRWLMVMAGGAAGSLARYLVALWAAGWLGGRFPAGTFLVNISGSFLAGLVMAVLTERWNLHPNWRLLLVVGFLGGYTTFSSFEYETYLAARSGRAWMGLAYVLASVTAGYCAVWAGAAIAGRRS